jgi:2-polyprenyl-3-methyl-5-hydroxy-6-metoxy-1,4-benzoquinol methylase
VSVPQPCPLCSDVRYRELKRFRDGVVVGECLGCGLVYTPLRHPAPATVHGEIPLADLMERYGPILRGERRHYRTAAYRDYLRRIARGAPRGRLLDVGCAHGFFLAEARRLGYRVAGVEFHPDMAAFARQALHLEVTQGLWADAALPPGPFDVITFNDTIEYMPDPVAALEKAAALLSPSGIVFVKTPNATYFRLRHQVARRIGRDVGGGEAFDPSTRVVHFTLSTLRRTLKSARLQAVESGSPRPIDSPLWHRTEGVWLEWEAPAWQGLPERTLRRTLDGLGKLEALVTGKENHLSPSIYMIGRKAVEGAGR